MKMKLLAAMAALGLTIGGAHAASGIFGTYVQVDGTWYGADEVAPVTLPTFQGADLGIFNIGDSLILDDAAVLTFKNGLSDVTGAEINWRVWSGVEGGAFNAVNVGFSNDATFSAPDGQSFSSGGDQQWSAPASTPDVLAGIVTPGTYTLEVYFRASSSDGDHFSSNGGNNFEATFTVVPEPSTMVLASLGLIGLVAARRRMAK
jgi:hypothetical protein